jgi:hypothetical protein
MSENSAAEKALFEVLGVSAHSDTPSVFIVGGARTGSTLLYQLLAHHWPFTYISNFTNTYFADTPVVGVAIEKGASVRAAVTYKSAYGKVEGLWAPSEGSYVFRHWYGGEQPSQSKSAEVLADRVEHMDLSLEAIWRLTGVPLLSKNAWNCFRIRDIASRYRNATFLWIRRDIAAAAISDLEARYRRGGHDVWNSATPANVEEIRLRPYWEQVAEQQFEYSRAISEGLEAYAGRRWRSVWYEQLCQQPESVIAEIDRFFMSRGMSGRASEAILGEIAVTPSRLDAADAKLVRSYIDGQARLRALRFKGE